MELERLEGGWGGDYDSPTRIEKLGIKLKLKERPELIYLRSYCATNNNKVSQLSHLFMYNGKRDEDSLSCL